MISEQQRRELGQDGKLFNIEVLFIERTWKDGYQMEGESPRRYTLENRTSDELMRVRKEIFMVGFLFPLAPGHYRIIKPSDISEVHVWRQDKYFET